MVQALWDASDYFLPSSLFQSTVKTKRDTVKGYFLAGGDMVWWPVSDLWFN